MVSLPNRIKDLFVYKEENMASLIKDRIWVRMRKGKS